MFNVTTFRGATAPHGEPLTLKTFDDVAQWLESSHRTAKCTCATAPVDKCPQKDGPGWSPASFEKNYRKQSNVNSVSLLTLDFDEINLQELEGLLETLKTRSSVIYSTHSFSPALEHYTVRVVLEIDRALLPREYTQAQKSAERILGLPGKSDASCVKDPSRFFYLPTTPQDGDYLFAHNRGYVTEVSSLTSYAAPISAPVALTTQAPIVSEVHSVDIETIRKELKKDAKLAPVIAGEPLAQQGSRDNTMTMIAGKLARALTADLHDDVVWELVRESCNQMPGEAPPGGWRPVFLEKFRRFSEQHQMDRAMKISNHLTKLSAKAADAVAASPNPDADVSEKYSDEEIAKWCVDLKYKNKSEFYRHQAIQYGGEYYLFCNGRYEPTDRVYGETDALGAMDREFARADIEIYKYDKNGNAIKRKMSDIVQSYGTVARSLSLSLIEQHTRYDIKTSTLIKATAPLRVTTPRHHEEVDRWLKLYDDTGKVQDWIACITRLDKQCAALFLNGVPGYGKTLLASGLSRLWGTQGYVEMDTMLEGDFNGSVLRMPFVFADEKLPDVKNVGSKIRTMIGSDKITVNEKFVKITQVAGNARYMLAANNPDVFRTDEELQNQDLEAIGERILFHRPHDAGLAAREYLMSLSAAKKESFRDDDKIAEHALWLRDNRQVVPGKRFIVQGEVTEFHEDLAVSTGKSAAVCEWIVRYIASYKKGAQNTEYIRVVDGRVLANPSAMNRQVEWETHVPGHRVPSTEIVAKALRRIETNRELITIDGVQVPFSSIKATLLARVAEKMGTMTAEEFLKKVEQCR